MNNVDECLEGDIFIADIIEDNIFNEYEMEESIANYFKRIVVMNKHGDYSLTARYDHSIVNQLFEENECKIMKIPKKLHSYSSKSLPYLHLNLYLIYI